MAPPRRRKGEETAETTENGKPGKPSAKQGGGVPLPIFVLVVALLLGGCAYLHSNPQNCPELLETTPGAAKTDLKKLPSVFAFVAIISAPGNAARRQNLRETWVADLKANKLPYRFIVGTTTQFNESLMAEEKEHGDIYVAPIEDKYVNLPYKGLYAQAYALQTYRFKYYIKVDDDSFVHVDRILEHFKGQKSHRKKYVGNRSVGIQPIRDPNSKWYLPQAAYHNQQHIPFNEGYFYGLSHDCVKYIVKNRDDLKPIGHLEDVSTAMWLHGIQVHPQHANGVVCANCGHPCRETLFTMGNLNEKQVRAMHEAKVAGKPLCPAHVANR